MVVINQNIKETADLFGGEREFITICPTCNNKNLKVRAIRKNHSKYYYCKNCDKSTSKPIHLTKDEEQLKVVCRFCEMEVVRKGRNRNKKQRYYCSNCDKYTISPKVLKETLKQFVEITCVKCKASKLKKKGFDRHGKQIYYCCNCQKHSLIVNYSLSARFVYFT